MANKNTIGANAPHLAKAKTNAKSAGSDYNSNPVEKQMKFNAKTYGEYIRNKNAKQSAHYPEHQKAIAYIIKGNAEVRRYVSIAILQHLIKVGDINRYGRVNFMWNKFQVKSDGLVREYFYSNDFFIYALIAALQAFANNVQEKIIKFLDIEINSTMNDFTDEGVAEVLASIKNYENDKANKDISLED